MANNNGWGKILARIILGAFVTLCIGVMSVMGNGIITNKREAVVEHVDIRKQIHKGDEKVEGKLTKAIQRLDDKVEAYQYEQRAVNSKILDKLDAIRNKI